MSSLGLPAGLLKVTQLVSPVLSLLYRVTWGVSPSHTAVLSGGPSDLGSLSSQPSGLFLCPLLNCSSASLFTSVQVHPLLGLGMTSITGVFPYVSWLGIWVPSSLVMALSWMWEFGPNPEMLRGSSLARGSSRCWEITMHESLALNHFPAPPNVFKCRSWMLAAWAQMHHQCLVQ